MVDFPTICALAIEGATACRGSRWSTLRTVSVSLADGLAPRLAMLAKQVAYMIEDGDIDLAKSVWWHLYDALRQEGSEAIPPG